MRLWIAIRSDLRPARCAFNPAVVWDTLVSVGPLRWRSIGEHQNCRSEVNLPSGGLGACPQESISGAPCWHLRGSIACVNTAAHGRCRCSHLCFDCRWIAGDPWSSSICLLRNLMKLAASSALNIARGHIYLYQSSYSFAVSNSSTPLCPAKSQWHFPAKQTLQAVVWMRWDLEWFQISR